MTEPQNARVRQIAPGVDAEMIATQTNIAYDPFTGEATINFQVQECLVVNGEVTPGGMSGFTVLQVSMQQIATRTVAAGPDPVTGADLSAISAAGIGTLLKVFYDVLFNERAAAIAAAQAEEAVQASALADAAEAATIIVAAPHPELAADEAPEA